MMYAMETRANIFGMVERNLIGNWGANFLYTAIHTRGVRRRFSFLSFELGRSRGEHEHRRSPMSPYIHVRIGGRKKNKKKKQRAMAAQKLRQGKSRILGIGKDPKTGKVVPRHDPLKEGVHISRLKKDTWWAFTHSEESPKRDCGRKRTGITSISF